MTTAEISILIPPGIMMYFILLILVLNVLNRKFRGKYISEGIRPISLPINLLVLFVVFQIIGILASVIPITLIHFGLLPDDDLLRTLASLFPLFLIFNVVPNFYKTS